MKKEVNVFINNLCYFCLVIIIAFGLITIIGCNGSDAGSSGSDGDEQTQSQEPSDLEVRNTRAYVLVDSIWTLHNLYIAGSSVGDKDISDADCPGGGTVSIVGTSSVSDGMNTRDLTYTFNNCVCAEESGTVTFNNGSCRQKGSWEQDEYQQIFYSGTSTMYFSSLDAFGPEYDGGIGNCEFNINEEMWVGDWSYSGSLCGEEINW